MRQTDATADEEDGRVRVRAAYGERKLARARWAKRCGSVSVVTEWSGSTRSCGAPTRRWCADLMP